MKKSKQTSLTLSTINELCDADRANTNYLVRRVRALITIETITKAFNRTQLGQLSLF